MWYDELPPGKSWTALWTGYVLCDCGAIRPGAGKCPVCGRSPDENDDSLSVDLRKFAVEGRPGGPAVTISLDRQRITVAGETATGAELKALAVAHGLHIRPNFLLLVELSGNSDRLVSDHDVVQLHEDLRLTTALRASMGAEGRYEDCVYLQLLEREWKRPVTSEDRIAGLDPSRQPSPALR